MNVTAANSNASVFASGLQNDMAKRHEDFNTLKGALQSGNVSTAQSAFAAFLQDVQNTSAKAGGSSLFAAGSQASKYLHAVRNALKSADLPGAQKAFAVLAQDIQTAWQPASGDPIAVAPPHHHLQGHRAGTFEANSANVKAAGSVLNTRA